MAQLKSSLGKYAQAAPQIAKQSLQDTGYTMLNIIHQFVPIDTGDLKRSYMWEMQDEDTMIIGSNQFRGVYARPYTTYYAPHVEFGWGNEAQPHFMPAWDRAESIFSVQFKKNFRKL